MKIGLVAMGLGALVMAVAVADGPRLTVAEQVERQLHEALAQGNRFRFLFQLERYRTEQEYLQRFFAMLCADLQQSFPDQQVSFLAAALLNSDPGSAIWLEIPPEANKKWRELLNAWNELVETRPANGEWLKLLTQYQKTSPLFELVGRLRYQQQTGATVRNSLFTFPFVALARAHKNDPDYNQMLYRVSREMPGLPRASELNDQECDSWLVKMLKGELEIKAAWEERGGDWADKVTEDGWRGFGEHLNRAAEFFTAADALRPELPEAAARMITVCGGDGSKGDKLQWLRKSIAAQADYALAFNQYLWFSRPRWGGRLSDLEEFAEACLEADLPGTLVPLFGLKALEIIIEEQEFWQYQQLFHLPGLREKSLAALDRLEAENLLIPGGRRLPLLRAGVEFSSGNYEEAQQLVESYGLQRYEDDFNRDGPVIGSFHWLHIPRYRYFFTGSHREDWDRVNAACLAGDWNGAVREMRRMCMSGEYAGAERDFLLDFYGLTRAQMDMATCRRRPLFCRLTLENDHSRHDKLILELLRFGINPDIRDSYGNTAIKWAMMPQNGIHILKALIDAGADLENPNEDAVSVLMDALSRKEVSIEKLTMLIDAGADVNAETYKGDTPIMYASNFNHPEAAELLLGRGAEVNAAGTDHLTALDYAFQQNLPKMIALLRKHGGKRYNELKEN